MPTGFFTLSPLHPLILLTVLSSRWLKIAASIGLLALLLASIDVRALITQVQNARPDLLLLVFLGYLLGQVLSAYKWQLLARPLGFTQSLRLFILYYFAGMYFNLFAPSTVLGDLGRGILLAGRKADIAPALQSVLADRVSGMVMLLWVSALGFLLYGPTILPPLLCYGTITAAVLIGIGWWLLPFLLARLGSPQQWVRRFLERLIFPYRAQSGLLVPACVLACVSHLFQIGLHVPLARALGISAPFWYLLLFFPLVTILSFLPLSFSGLGVREGGYVMFLGLIGIGREKAMAIGLLWSAIGLVSGVIGGLALWLSPEVKEAFRSSQFPVASNQSGED